MRKIISITFLMFFIHSFILEIVVGRLDAYIPKYNGDTDHGMHFIVALFFTAIIYMLSVILIIIEYRMEFNYKGIMLFLVFGNSLLEFFMCSFYEYKLFSSPERFDTTSIIIVLIYFTFELILTYYMINRLYQTEQN